MAFIDLNDKCSVALARGSSMMRLPTKAAEKWSEKISLPQRVCQIDSAKMFAKQHREEVKNKGTQKEEGWTCK